MSFPLTKALAVLRREAKRWPVPFVAGLAGDPFRVLVACLLSLRTRDAATEVAEKRLRRRARSPRGLLRIDEGELAEVIAGVAFPKARARQLHALARRLLEDHGGAVPDSEDALLALPGVGPKTANLVLAAGFGKPAICVDVHVHRIPNRWGAIATSSPEETELALRTLVPRKRWSELNPLLVAFGQRVCRPVSPLCSSCPLAEHCARVGVTVTR